jgi:hypothetical protein
MLLLSMMLLLLKLSFLLLLPLILLLLLRLLMLIGLSALMATLCWFANADAVAVILLAFLAAVARLVKLILLISCCCWCINGLLGSLKEDCCDDYQRRFRFVHSFVRTWNGGGCRGGGEAHVLAWPFLL